MTSLLVLGLGTLLLVLCSSIIWSVDCQSSDRISVQKCREYSKTSGGSKCSRVVSPLLGYRPAREREFPHSVLIGSQEYRSQSVSRIEWFCTGVLISHEFVISLAECGFTSIKEATVVRLGEFNYGSTEDDTESINVRVAEVILHPNFTDHIAYNNIALLRLDQSIEFSQYIEPACLTQPNATPITRGSVAGWPFKLYPIPMTAQHLQDKKIRKYDVNLMPLDECKGILSTRKIDAIPDGISDAFVCASIVIEASYSDENVFKLLRPLEEIDGAPLQYLHKSDKCIYSVLGLSQFGPAFGILNPPLVFIRIQPFLLWIEKIVWPDE